MASFIRRLRPGSFPTVSHSGVSYSVAASYSALVTLLWEIDAFVKNTAGCGEFGAWTSEGALECTAGASAKKVG